MVLKELLEMDGEFLPNRKSTPDYLAAELLDKANGDPATAKKMAHSFIAFLIASIDEQSKGSAGQYKHPQNKPAKGYKQTSTHEPRSWGHA